MLGRPTASSRAAHVATVAGTPFGAPGYLRLSYAVSEDDIRGGIEAIRKALADLR